jgi:TonB family protein
LKKDFWSGALRIALLGAFWICGVVHADCSIAPDHFVFRYSDEALVVRNAFFASQCAGSTTDLVDATDPTLVGRLQLPSKAVRHVTSDFYPGEERRRHHEGSAVIATVVETDGSVRHAVVLESSGYKVLDQSAMNLWKGTHYDGPATLDGKLVRVLITFDSEFWLTKPRSELPTMLRKSAVEDLASRIVEPYNRGDMAALYDSFDESIRSVYSVEAFGKRYGELLALSGKVKSASFRDFTQMKTRNGKEVYKLNYLLELFGSAFSQGMMGVTVIERESKPSIVSFDISGSGLR